MVRLISTVTYLFTYDLPLCSRPHPVHPRSQFADLRRERRSASQHCLDCADKPQSPCFRASSLATETGPSLSASPLSDTCLQVTASTSTDAAKCVSWRHGCTGGSRNCRYGMMGVWRWSGVQRQSYYGRFGDQKWILLHTWQSISPAILHIKVLNMRKKLLGFLLSLQMWEWCIFLIPWIRQC